MVLIKACNKSWDVKKVVVNFNQKQWRQDFGAFVRDKLNWYGATKVSKVYKVSDMPLKENKGKTFEVYNDYENSVVVHFQNNNEILGSTNEELVSQYFQERGLK